CQQHNSYRTF
nr:immunoglobulin light chain junction region [Macaca mulatta]MOX48040.1 immunoglobulin light chain junction region [Macaca mulatta]MOX48276.1 immunoglobulin light chain junction region [Macaca mulatta]MOX48582.1 immunoglobulin light chain junction region [Macaca mulatta]MOX48731.1 immunoglobulin light chain junction region [Macaca mulatta]